MLSLYRTHPLRTSSILDDFRRSFDGLLQAPVHWNFQIPSVGPQVHTSEGEDAYTLTLEVPGYAQEDIEVSAKDGVLSIQGTRTTEIPEGYELCRQERGQREFEQKLTLPRGVAIQETSATLANGILTIAIPKDAESKPRQIEIKRPSTAPEKQ